MNEEKERICAACGADLAGPFQPKISLTQALAVEQAGQEPLKVTARSWICPECGLVHWYAEGVADLTATVPADEVEAPQPDSSYQRRTQMLRMLQRVKRM